MNSIKSGIYKITNLINNHCYIGSSENLIKRKWTHFKSSSNQHLQRAMEKYERKT